jgi:hypothetical protein
MPEVHSINTLPALHRAMINRKHHAVTLSKRHNHRARLHARSLFSHNKFAASEIFVGFRQQHCDLKREDVLAIQILVQAVVIVSSVLEMA